MFCETFSVLVVADSLIKPLNGGLIILFILQLLVEFQDKFCFQFIVFYRFTSLSLNLGSNAEAIKNASMFSYLESLSLIDAFKVATNLEVYLWLGETSILSHMEQPYYWL